MKPMQASLMPKMYGTRLPSTPWPFWTCIGIQMTMKNIASKSNLALLKVSNLKSKLWLFGFFQKTNAGAIFEIF